MEIEIDSNLVKPAESRTSLGWKVWRKRTNLFSFSQFGFADLRLMQPITDYEGLAARIRDTAKWEFGGRWYRAAGFGVVIRFTEVSGKPLQLLDNIDLRNRFDGNLWQWTILVFEEEKAVVGMHMWYHGYLHPVFHEIADKFIANGYEVHRSDTETDPLMEKLLKVNNTLRKFRWISYLVE